MAIENNIDNIASSSIYLDSLVKANPDGSNSEVRELDNHARGIKNVLLNTFTAIAGAITATHTELNLLAGFSGTPLSDDALDTDDTLAADSDTKIATQQATKAYVDNNVVMLDTPIAVALGAGWSSVSDGTLASAGAKFAIVSVELQSSVSAGVVVPTVGLRRTGSAFAINTNGTTLNSAIVTGTVSNIWTTGTALVKLDASQDFDAYTSATGGTIITRKAYILGYYV